MTIVNSKPFFLLVQDMMMKKYLMKSDYISNPLKKYLYKTYVVSPIALIEVHASLVVFLIHFLLLFH